MRTSLRILNLLDALDSAPLEAGGEEVSGEASLEAMTSEVVEEGEGPGAASDEGAEAVSAVEDDGLGSVAPSDDLAASEEGTALL